MLSRALTVLRTGPAALVSDLGRPGLRHLGVPRSGALDVPALRLANRLVGNPTDAAGLEVLLGGLVVRAESACVVAVTGAPVTLRAQARPVASHQAVYLGAGDRLELAPMTVGMRCYLAVSGGIEVPKVLGSRSTDLLSGLGPAPLADGDRVPLGAVTGQPPSCAWPVPVTVPPSRVTVPVLCGPRHDWFVDPVAVLCSPDWSIDSRSNRIGLRLAGGTPLRRTDERRMAELASEPLLPGSVQVPPNGLPVIFLADGPTTGGYPVIGVVPASALPHLAQARPGITLRFQPS